ncbi:MAG: acyl-CoA dehydrogenase family protein [Candidatus Acidiferrales bacterium]
MDFALTEEQTMISELAQKFAREVIAPNAREFDAKSEFPTEIVKQARELGLMNVSVPEEFGGTGGSVLDLILVAEQLGWGCSGIALAILLNNLAADPINIAANDDQRKKYFGLLAESFGAYALTEPSAGSDVSAIKTRAERKGKEWVLNGQKIWISNASVAQFFVVFAKTAPDKGTYGITAFLVDLDTKGLSVGKPLAKMGQKASPACEVFLEDVVLGDEQRLGKENEGFKIAMRVFDRSRPMVGAMATGLSQRALDESLSYATERQSFGKAIIEHQAVGFKISEMGMRTEAARLLARKAAWTKDHGLNNTLLASYAKAYGSDTGMWAATEATQILGGYGYSREYPTEKLMRDAKVMQLYEGTNEIQRLVMQRQLVKLGSL